MARKVKETPVLSGKDLERFNRQIEASANRKVSDAERKRIEDAYRRFKLVTPS